MVIRSVAARRSIEVADVSDVLASGPKSLLIATSARADSDIPERRANALKRIFSTEGRAVMHGSGVVAAGSAGDDT